MYEKEALEVLKSDDLIEPETIRTLFPHIPEDDMDKFMAFVTLYKNRHFWENFYIFENIVLALNDVKPDFAMLQGSTPEQIWYALDIAHSLYPAREFAPEILKYVEFMFNKFGVYVYPQYLPIPNPYYERANQLANEGPFPIGDDATEEIQASKLMAIRVYLDAKK